MTTEEFLAHHAGELAARNAYRYHIGIDPGAHTGVGVWDRKAQRLIEVATLDFWRTIDHVCATYAPDVTLLAIEDPSGNAPVFAERLKDRTNIRVALRKAQNVGANKENARLLIEGFERRGYRVESFTPKKSKWTADYFARVTGWTGASSEHSRDAASFVYGK